MTASRLLDHPAALCNVVRRLVVETGNALQDRLDIHAEGPDAKAVHAMARNAVQTLRVELDRIAPGVPVIGPEDDGAAVPVDGASFWIVHSLHGYREDAGEDGGFTVDVALVRDAVPVLGVVYAPVQAELYAAHGPGTAIRHQTDTGRDKSVRVRAWPAAGLVVVAGDMAGESTLLEPFIAQYKVARLVHPVGGLKLCHIAAGKADLYPCFAGATCCETAAGDAILRGADGLLTDFRTGAALSYASMRHPAFMAASAR